jgi:hypothetical protein
VSSPNDALVPGPIDDFAQGFDTDVFLSDGDGRINLGNFVSVETCVGANNCTTTYNDGSYRLTGELTNVSFRSPVVAVNIDIKPGSDPNAINLKSRGVIPVAILTTDTFDATTVDHLSAKFGPAGVTEAHGRGHVEDVNGDTDWDLVFHFRTKDTGIACGDTSAMLTGTTVDGQPIKGQDSVKTVGCKRKGN